MSSQYNVTSGVAGRCGGVANWWALAATKLSIVCAVAKLGVAYIDIK
jgi:hypothetical protein